MRQAKEMFKRILPSPKPQSQETSARRLPTATLNVAARVLDTFPIPGAGAVVHSVLDVVESINVRVHSIILHLQQTRSFTCSFVTNQKSRYNAQVIADLNRHIDSFAAVLEPISKMDRSEIPPDLDEDIQALIRYASIQCLSIFC